jgi:hypothetical protein
MSSILQDVKRAIGPSASYDAFDPDLIMHINSVFSILKQMGVGPQDETFKITTGKEDWYDFFEEGENLEMVRSYMYMKVRLMFDPPQSSFVIEALNRQIAEFEWRLNVEVDPGQPED